MVSISKGFQCTFSIVREATFVFGYVTPQKSSTDVKYLGAKLFVRLEHDREDNFFRFFNRIEIKEPITLFFIARRVQLVTIRTCLQPYANKSWRYLARQPQTRPACLLPREK